MRNKISSRSILATVILTLSLGSPFASHILGPGILPLVHPAFGALGPNNNLGIDCALGASADSPNPFPTPISTKDSDGVIDSGCQWAGDVDADPAATLDPLTSDNPETLSPQVGGGFIADVIFTNMNTTINGFSITLSYDPRILDFVAFDQSGLTFGANVGCPSSNPQCTLQLTSSVDRVSGVIRLDQVLEQIRIGPNGDTGNLNRVTLFRMRFDVVGAGYTSIHFGTNIITFAVSTSTGPDPHFTLDGSFSTQDFFNLVNSQPLAPSTAWFNASWSSSPNPEIPGSPLTFIATASCSYCLGTLTYNWDFSSVDSSTYTSKIAGTGSVITIVAPPPLVNRVTLTVTNGTASVSATRLLPLTAAGPTSTLPVGVVRSAAGGSWLGGVPSYSGSYNLCPAQSSTDFTVCSKPTVLIPIGTQSQNKTVALSYNYAGGYNAAVSITDSAPSQVGGPSSAAGTFLINVTGTPAVFTVLIASNSSTVRAGQTVQFSSSVVYNNNYPTIFQSTTFQHTIFFGDGTTTQTTSSAGLFATFTHTYSSAGNFSIKVTAQETRTTAASKSRIQENGFLQLGGNQTLSADFVISPASPQAGQSVSFNALASGGTPPYSFAWNFGDGTTGSGNPATHAYASAGPFTITLTVTDAKSKSVPASHTLTVSAVTGRVPIVGAWSRDCGSFNITNVSCPGVTLTPNHQIIVQVNVTNAPTFNAFEFALYYDPHYLKALSTDVTGATGQATVFGTKASVLKNDTSKPGAVYLAVVGLGSAAAFTGGSGTLVNIIFNITATGVSPLSLAAGMAAPSAFARDASGGLPDFTHLANTNSAGQSYYIGVDTSDGYFTNAFPKLGPVAKFTDFPQPATSEGQSVTFNATASFDPDNPAMGSILSYFWDFGDGQAEIDSAPVTHHLYNSVFGGGGVAESGNFTVRLTLIDRDNGFQGMKAQLVTINPRPPDQPPVASFTVSPANPTVGQLVTFNGSGSFDPDGTIMNYMWNFGDGATISPPPTGVTVTHVYQSTGNFTVTLTVQDNAGLFGTQFRTIHIAPQTGLPPVARFTFTPFNPLIGQSVFFDGSRSTDADGSVTFWSWNFGDGSFGAGTFPVHTYFTPGNYTVTLTVTDTEQLSASTFLTVPVHSLPAHDVAIDSVQPNPTRAVSTQIVSITIVLENTGSSQVTVNITAYQDSKVIGSINGATLFPNFDGFHQTFFFNIPWDTAGIPIGNHTITARVFLADDPTPADNFASGGPVTILPPPVLKLVPSSGSLGTKVVIEGSGFPVPQFSFFGQIDFIQVTFDNMTSGFISTSTGTFNFTFDVPLSQPGTHYVNVLDEISRAHASAAFQVLPTPGPLIVTVKTAAIYFSGDTATIYILPTLNGVQAGPNGLQLQLTLVKPDGSTTTLATLFTSSGVYKSTFSIPKTGSLGTYTLVATAHMTGASDGSSIATFEVKPTWLSSNASNIAGGATVVTVIGLAAVAWRKGVFRKKDDDQATRLLNGSEGFAE